jgi:hypothetical protein
MGAVEFVAKTAYPLQLKNVLMQALSPLSAEQSSLIRGSASPNPSAIHPGEPHDCRWRNTLNYCFYVSFYLCVDIANVFHLQHALLENHGKIYHLR